MLKFFNVTKVILFFCVLFYLVYTNINILIQNDGTKISYIDNKTIPSFVLPSNKEEIMDSSYFTTLNNVTTENFVRRDSFIEEYFILNRALGKSVMNNILIDEEENLQYYFSDLTSDEKQNIFSGLKNIETYFEKESYYMFKVPSKNAVYSDLYYNYTEEVEHSYVNEISNYIEHNIAVNYYDLNDFMKSYKEQEIYYKTDHHWNNVGSFLAYEYIYNVLIKDFDLSKKLKVVDTKGYEDVFVGSRARPIGYGYRLNQQKDDFYYNVTDDMSEYTMTIYGEEYEGGQEIFYFSNTLDYIDKYENLYSVFMGGDYHVVNIENKTIDNDYTVLIFKDSFTNAILPHISSHFKNIVVVDLRYSNENIPYYLEKYEPDLILQIFSNFKVMDMYK